MYLINYSISFVLIRQGRLARNYMWHILVLALYSTINPYLSKYIQNAFLRFSTNVEQIVLRFEMGDFNNCHLNIRNFK
jgi:hypothetical protein